MAQPGLFDLDERLARLSQKGDTLERLATVIGFTVFRSDLEQAVPRADRSKGGRPPFDHAFARRSNQWRAALSVQGPDSASYAGKLVTTS